jgi:hypothetical protein
MLDRVRNFLEKRRISKDIETTFIKTFQLLLAADRRDEQLRKRFDAVAALASCVGALRDTYPRAIVEEESMAMAFVQANVDRPNTEVDAMLEAILRLIRDCPNDKNDQVGVVTWLVAPRLAQRARDAGLV